MKIWQRIFLVSMLVTIVSMNIVGLFLIRNQYQQSLSYIQKETGQKAERIQEKLISMVENTMAVSESVKLVTNFYDNNHFAVDDLMIEEIVRETVLNVSDVGVCILVENVPYKNQEFESFQKHEGQFGFVYQDEKLIFCGVKTYLFYGRNMEIQLQNDATNVREMYLKQMSQLQLYSCFFSVFAAAVLMGLVYFLLYPLKKVRLGVHHIAGGHYETRLQKRGHTELTELSADVNDMAEKIQNHMRQMEEIAEHRKVFIGNMAHEMKTPLTSILGFADILSIKPGLPEDERREYSEIIVREATRLRNLSGKLMELVQIQNGVIEFQKIDLSLLLRKSISAQELLMKEKGLVVVEDLMQSWIYGDYDLIQSLVFNLLDNSRKASVFGANIEVCLRDGEEETVLIIRDYGRGIESEELEKIREPFYMIDKSRSRKAGGAGLGLTLCTEIAALHHGELKIYSELGKGCKVVVTFRKDKYNE